MKTYQQKKEGKKKEKQTGYSGARKGFNMAIVAKIKSYF